MKKVFSIFALSTVCLLLPKLAFADIAPPIGELIIYPILFILGFCFLVVAIIYGIIYLNTRKSTKKVDVEKNSKAKIVFWIFFSLVILDAITIILLFLTGFGIYHQILPY